MRGVNLNPGADPEDMVAVRLWAESGRVITIRRRRLLALQDLHEHILVGKGANNVGGFVADVARRLVERMASAIGELDEQLDSIEEESNDSMAEKRVELAELRRQAIRLRRYLSPQRDALSRLAAERVDWLGELERLEIREVLDRTTRYVEDLEASRERAAVTQEEFSNRLAEELNRRMYALSIVAGIFLPLSFATGLLGINVGGIPGSDTPIGFAAVCVILGLLAVGELLIFRRLRWF